MEANNEAKPLDKVINDLGFGRFHIVVILLCGLVQASDMLEIQYVSLLSQKLQCIWWISDYWKSFITSATFLGLFCGAIIWGPLGDKHCRRNMTGICMGYVFLYGCLTALSPNIIWVVILRFMVGTGIGGIQPLCSTLVGEFMPAQQRGLAWFLYQSIWCVGGVLELGMAWLILDKPHGWSYLAVATALPMLLLMLPWLLWLPSSPRQSLLQGRLADTRKTLDRMADANGQERFVGDFEVQDLLGKHKRGSIPELLTPNKYLRQTLQIIIIAFGGGFGYYGTILLIVQVPLLLRDRCMLTGGNSTSAIGDWGKGLDRACHSCAAFDYVEMLIPTMADLSTALLNGFIIERLLGRRVIMSISFCLSAVLMPLLSFCMASAARVALFFIIRFLVLCGYNTVGLYVLEVYPTTLRTTAAGFLFSFSRIASILVPFVAQLFVVRVSLLGGLLIFSVLLFAAGVSSALLPLETKDMALPQTSQSQLAPIPAEEEEEEEETAAKAAIVQRGDANGSGVNGGAYGSVSKTD